MIKKTLNLIKKIFAPRYTFSAIRRSDVLIFDKFNADLLMPYLKNVSISYLASRGEEYNLRVLLFSFFQSGSLKANYYRNFISKVQPKVIITFQDNNKDFYELKKDTSCKTMFIQNGWRGYYADIFELLEKEHDHNYGVDYMFTFGGAVGKEYLKYIKGNAYPLGSFKNNLIPEFFEPKVKNSLSFISQWHPEGFVMGDKFYEHNEFFSDIEKPVLEFLANYALKKGKKFFIIPRNTVGSLEFEQEKKYFESLLGRDYIEFLVCEDKYSSYKVLSMSEVVVTLDSTLGYESAIRGTKTAFFSIRSEILKIPGLTFGWPKDTGKYGDFWTNVKDVNLYNDILDRLFDMSDEKWNNILKNNNYDHILCHDPGNLALEKVLRRELAK